MRQVRVLYLIDSLRPSGAELSLLAMVPHLRREGVTLTVAGLGEGGELAEDLRAAGADAVVLGARGRLASMARGYRLARAAQPDLVHTTLFEADVTGRPAARLAGVPVVSSLVNVAYGPEQERASGAPAWKLRAARALDAATARLCVRLHAISHEVAAVMGARLGLRPERVDVVPRARDPAALGERTPERRARVRAELGLADGEPLVLAAARQEPQKGLDVLVEAAAALPGARVVVAGREGTATPSLRAAVGDRVRFLGRRDDVADLLAACDVFAFPSRWEGLGSVLVEALALEAPIVASDLAAVREVVGDCGVFVPPGDAGALAGALAGVLHDPARAAARAKAGRERFLASFTAERVAAGMAAFYRRALGEA
jgi:glycosyltransferase involved in cell wall biosynthesis